MKVLLINVCLRYDSPKYIPPVGLGYIATALKDYEFDVLDLDVLRSSEVPSGYDVYLMGSIVTGYKYVKQLAQGIRDKNPSAVIVAGNTVADSIPRMLLDKTEVDVAVMGEGDVTVVALLD